MPLKSAIEAWDGKSVEALCRIHDQHRDDPDLAATLVELIGALRYRLAATRLLIDSARITLEFRVIVPTWR